MEHYIPPPPTFVPIYREGEAIPPGLTFHDEYFEVPWDGGVIRSFWVQVNETAIQREIARGKNPVWKAKIDNGWAHVHFDKRGRCTYIKVKRTNLSLPGPLHKEFEIRRPRPQN